MRLVRLVCGPCPFGGLTGNTLALYTSPEGRPWVLSTPFALPDELIRVRIDGHSRYHSNADLLEVVEPNEMLRLKEGEGVGCKYFGKWCVPALPLHDSASSSPAG